MKNIVNDIIESAIDMANDLETNFGDIYVGGSYYDDYINNTNEEIDITIFVDMIITEIEKDDRVLEVAGVSNEDVLDIIIKDEILDKESWEND